MSTQAQIVLSVPAKGRFIDGIISGTPKPGTVMEVTTTAKVGGLFTWRVFQPGTDGIRSTGCPVLTEDENQGYGPSQAYVTGTVGRIYFPIHGDELQMLLANVAGTSDTFVIGELLIVDTGTGKLIKTTGSPESEPFVCMETISTALTADALAHVMYTGN